MTSRKGHSFATRQLETVLVSPAGEPTNGKDCPRWLLLDFEGLGQTDALDGARV